MWTWNRMEKISWTEHTTNEEVLAKIGDTHNKKEAKEMDWTHAQSRLAAKNVYRRKNRGNERNRKTKTDNAGLDEGVRLWKAERRHPITRGVATSDIQTCLEGR